MQLYITHDIHSKLWEFGGCLIEMLVNFAVCSFRWVMFTNPHCCKHTHEQVRKRPLNKKELAKNEEDIIETNANALTVHETKLKVSCTVNSKYPIISCCNGQFASCI